MCRAVELAVMSAVLAAAGSLRAGVNLGNVVCLGDSITEGKNDGGGGYRQFLQNDLSAQGYTYAFVGKEDNGQPQNYTGYSIGMADPNHEGYGGFTIDDTLYGSSQMGHAAPAVGTLLNNDATTNPDGTTDPVSLVLLMTGTNDMGLTGSNFNPDAPSNLNQLVGQILNTQPNVQLIVGSIPPPVSSVGLTRVQAYNQYMVNMVAGYQTQGFNIRFADTYSGLNLTEIDPTDGIHPLPSGYQNIAQMWDEAIGQSSMNVSNSSVVFPANSAWASGTLFVNNGGTATFQGDSGSGDSGSGISAKLSVTVPAGSVLFESTQHLANLTIGYQNDVKLTTTANGSRSVLITPSLIDNGTLDLTDNEMVVQDGSLPAVTALIENGFAGNSATGCIISSTAAADTTHLTTLGIILNNSKGTQLYGSGTPLGSFDGSNPGMNDVLVRYTYFGDVNLDGKIDGSDYSLIDNGYLTHATGWFNGDFNYDGVVDGSDFTLIDNASNMQGAQLSTQDASPTARLSGSGSSAVPEPTSLILLGIGAVGLQGRKRSCVTA